MMIETTTVKPATRWPRALWFAVAGLILVGCSTAQSDAATGAKANSPAQVGRVERTALDDYVAAPDSNYAYRLVNTQPGDGQTTYILEMTSQAWLTTNEVDQPLWKHWLNIVRPDTVTSAKALLFIGGGANGGAPPKGLDGNLIQIALATKSVVAELKMVPNQPLVFAGETAGRKEDSLIA